MYERSATVLERYFEEKLGLNQKSNLKTNYENYKMIVEEMQRYKALVEDEEKIIKEFDRVATEIQSIQKSQEKLYKSNQKLEDDRNGLFNNLDEDPINLEKKLTKIEESIEKNNEQNKQLKEDFVKLVEEFIGYQKERNKYAKSRRLAEANNMNIIDKSIKQISEIEEEIVKSVKNSTLYEDDIEEKLSQIMINNGKDERVGFNLGAINASIKVRLEIAKEEANCYVTIYDRMKKLLTEIENDSLKLSKHQKTMKDIYVKLTFLNAKKEYIVRFLDNERMTAINGLKVHNKMMEEACANFEKDVKQIDNLYELIIRETTGKATNKAYKELYNKTYLKEIEDKEKNFEQEVNKIKIHTGTIINSNYWRIEGIKNIYEVFLKEVSENFERDLSEYTLEETEQDIKEEENNEEEVNLNNFAKRTGKIKFEKELDENEEENNFDDEIEDDTTDEYEDETDDEIEDDGEIEQEQEDEEDEIDLSEFDFGDDNDEEDDFDFDNYFEEDEKDNEENYEENDDDDDFELEEEDEEDFEEDFEEDVEDLEIKNKKKKNESGNIFGKLFSDKKEKSKKL